VIRVTDEDFVKVRKDDLAGKFDLVLSISTPEEDEHKIEKLSFTLQTIGPSDDPQVRRKIMGDIARLQKMPDLAKWLEEYEPQPDPLVVEEQQLKIELLKAQIANEYALAETHKSQAQLDAAKVGTEQVKQGEIQATTDQKNLDFVEQESGVTQERNLQKAGEQGRSNVNLKMVDHQLRQQGDREKFKNTLLTEYVKGKLKKAA